MMKNRKGNSTLKQLCIRYGFSTEVEMVEYIHKKYMKSEVEELCKKMGFSLGIMYIWFRMFDFPLRFSKIKK